ncbi:hypothetical protein PMI01_04561 [Caulobacter sp. AP07]|uniref:hypothetical protein n=1 Tax=Caulobacter sp. AP07 TaxID=1144304 RepID=UPI0002721B99|nr:hypothetical protein [Caulobacter sp. AP07]EJL24985.1 hypothetical protein PMI01_04561 [Caulobacter sp. AP07]
MILTLIWKWLRGLWRDAHPAPALETPKPVLESEAALDFCNHSDDGNNAGVVIFQGDGPRPAK